MELGILEDKRKDVRVSLKLRLCIEVDGNKSELSTVNISRGGAFIETKNPLEVGKVCNITIYLPHREIKAKAEIIWVSFPHEKSSYIPGMGVKFVDMNIEDMDYLGSYLGYELKKQLIVDKEKDYDLNERIQLFTTNILDFRNEFLVIFTNEFGELFDTFSRLIFESLDSSLKKYYELKKDSINVGEALLMPYSGKFHNRINYLLFTSVPTFFDAYGEEILRKSVVSFLTKSSEQISKSVTVPAFSLFETSFPIPVIARILLGTTYGFVKNDIFPKKVFFFCSQYEDQSRLIFEKTLKEIFN